MKVIVAPPPNFKQIAAAFPWVVDRVGVLYCYDGACYNPSGVEVDDYLLAHERVHVTQQEVYGVKHWWDRYVECPQFRFEQELPAHQAEYAATKTIRNREKRVAMLLEISQRLAGPLYGGIADYSEVIRMIRTGVPKS